jgi:hypothetical protein
VQHIVECLYNDARMLGRAVMVAIAVGTPLERKGGRAHGGVVIFVSAVDAVIESFKRAPEVWFRYWYSPTFRCESGDNTTVM